MPMDRSSRLLGPAQVPLHVCTRPCSTRATRACLSQVGSLQRRSNSSTHCMGQSLERFALVGE
eukprot:7053660-Pyramimonas_sp.AAC.1